MGKIALGLAAAGALLFSMGSYAAAAKHAKHHVRAQGHAVVTEDPGYCSCCPECHCVNFDLLLGGTYVDQHGIHKRRLTLTDTDASASSPAPTETVLITDSKHHHLGGSIVFGMHSYVGHGVAAVFDFGYRYLAQVNRTWKKIVCPANDPTLQTITELNDIFDKIKWDAFVFRTGIMFDFACNFYAKALVGGAAVNTKYRFDDEKGKFVNQMSDITREVIEINRTNFVPVASIALGWMFNCHWGMELSYEHIFGEHYNTGSFEIIGDISGGKVPTTFEKRIQIGAPNIDLVTLAINFTY